MGVIRISRQLKKISRSVLGWGAWGREEQKEKSAERGFTPCFSTLLNLINDHQFDP